jgi:AraC family transcriptional regulator
MLYNLAEKRDRLKPAEIDLGAGSSVYNRLGKGEGAFRFPDVTVGFVLNRSPRHRGAFGRDGRIDMPMEAGQGWVLPAGLDGSAEWGQDLDFLNVHLREDAFAKVGASSFPDLQIVSQLDDPAVVTLAMNLHESAAMDDSVARMYRDTMTLALAAHVMKTYGATVEAPSANSLDPRMRRAVEFIEQNIAKDITLDAIASVAGMSAFHFARSFKTVIGLPPHGFVLKRRVELARALLKSTTLPIVEIAFRVGYENVSHFTQVFRKQSGMTPGQFRTA